MSARPRQKTQWGVGALGGPETELNKSPNMGPHRGGGPFLGFFSFETWFGGGIFANFLNAVRAVCYSLLVVVGDWDCWFISTPNTE